MTKKCPTLCVIDDDELYKLLIKKTLANFQQETFLTCYPNGEEAINFFMEHQNSPDILPDIIFLDINMPVMDGWTFLDKYLSVKYKFAKPISIYIASSSTAEQDKLRAKKYKEISGYLEKPLHKNKIIKILDF